MCPRRRRRCLRCGELFEQDYRNRPDQRHCQKPCCRAASKAASQRRWLSRLGNRDYFRGPENVLRGQRWRGAHPTVGALFVSALFVDSGIPKSETGA